MWGSSRFQSPEEYQLGADIDEVTNVYTIGATAFALFGEYNAHGKSGSSATSSLRSPQEL